MRESMRVCVRESMRGCVHVSGHFCVCVRACFCEFVSVCVVFVCVCIYVLGEGGGDVCECLYV